MSHPEFFTGNTGNSRRDDGRPQGATQPSRTTPVPTINADGSPIRT
ncbi:MAG TPA: hypothetical protein VKR42_04765 [Ktedonobacteraceae bacterium]|nr:hypothetical protein [Ktedonobacteraceae bacterium]